MDAVTVVSLLRADWKLGNCPLIRGKLSRIFKDSTCLRGLRFWMWLTCSSSQSKMRGERLATLKAPNFPPNMKSTGRRACRGKICFLKVPSFYGSLAFEGCLQTEKENFGSSTLCSSGKNVFKNVETSSPHTLVSTPSVLCHIVQNKLC